MAEHNPLPPNEPSVLDYLKSRLTFGKGRTVIQLPQQSPDEPGLSPSAPQPPTPREPRRMVALPWLVLAALLLAILAQASLEPRITRTWSTGAALYLAAALVLTAAVIRGEWQLAAFPVEEHSGKNFTFRIIPLVLALAAGVLAFRTFDGGLFTNLNVTLWLFSLACLIYALWDTSSLRPSIWQRSAEFFSRSSWSWSVSRWVLVLLAAFALAVFFRAAQLSQIPNEMVSDHAEKLWDVRDVLNGQTSIYFPRNTGREFFQMYLTALVSVVFQTGLSFMSLKIGTVICGLLTLPFIYLLGKEIANRRVGLIALAFAGIAYWPNLISRIGLRFTLYPFFYAPALYFFLRGLRTKNSNFFILSGLFLGLGLHGYSPYRVVPFILLIACALYILHTRDKQSQQQAVLGLLITAIVSLFVFLPLLRYTIDNPDIVLLRTLTRLSDLEQPLPGNPWLIFLSNLWRGLTMFAWDNGEVWVISITHRPILDIISGALFHLGSVLVLLRYMRRRSWHDLFILLSIPLLMMPSILSIAFPGENPSLNRTAGALIPVFLLVGLALDSILSALEKQLGPITGTRAAAVLGLVLFLLSANQNYNLVFNEYARVYRLSSWNTSEIGETVRNFSELQRNADTTYLVGYPHWVDSRLVMLNAGYPERDNAILPEQFALTLEDKRAKMFILNPQDIPNLDALRALFPSGWLQTYRSRVETKDFWIFFVPAVGDVNANTIPSQP